MLEITTIINLDCMKQLKQNDIVIHEDGTLPLNHISSSNSIVNPFIGSKRVWGKI